MKIQKLSDLFLHTLQDIYYAENHIVKALPKMIKASDSRELSKAFADHLEQTKEHVTRLEQVFKMIDHQPKAAKCPAIDGILDEAKELMDEIKDRDTRDAAMIAAAQAVEHYEITRYGTLVAWANLLDLNAASKILDRTLKEEHAADSKLTKIAESHLNAEAVA
jgi:ferritin-like metal-binding protein YciE